ncbi:MAG: hypothetical protein ACI9MB_003532 [Verrucomicrobiales bacterium]|jgi:hypothetical protein
MKVKYLFLWLLTLSVSPLSAQVPANDRFAARISIPAAIPATVSGTTVAATAEANEPGHTDWIGGNVASNSVWYQWSSTITGWVEFTVSSAVFDATLAVYTGSSVSGLTTVGGSDWGFVGDESTFIQVSSGVTYSIGVDGYSPSTTVSESGAFDLRIAAATVPANDRFADALLLVSALPVFEFDGRTIQSSVDPNEPNHAEFIGNNVVSNSVWYRWTAPVDAFVGVNVNGALDSVAGTDFDYVVGVYSGSSLTDLDQVSAADFWFENAVSERAVFDAVEGVEYWIAVDGWSADGSVTQSGRFFLDIYVVPPNDDFLFAETLDGNLSVATVGTTLNGSSEYLIGEPEHGFSIAGNNSSNSVWYTWIAPSAAEMTLAVTDLAFDPVIAVYTGGALDGLTEVAAADAGANGGSEILGFTAVAGTLYTIVVDAYSASGLTVLGGDFNLELSGTGIGGGPSAYDIWIANYPSITGDIAAADASASGDGIANLTKLVLGLDPTLPLAEDPNRDNYPKLVTFNGNPALQYVVDPDNLGTGDQTILHQGQVSNDLKAWVASGLLNIGDNTWVAEIQITGTEAGYLRIKVTIPEG